MSTFVLRPQFEVGSPEYLTAFRDRMDARENGHGGAFQAVFFGGKSTDSEKLGKYFAPFCKNKLLVSQAEPRDIDPQHFNILLQDPDVQFSSTISFCPSLSTMGVGLTYRQNLNRFRKNYDPEKRHWYFEISTPLTYVETSMGLSECMSFTGNTQARVIPGLDQKFYSNMTQAFNQPAWKYGKINGCQECSKVRLADISVMIGWETVKCHNLILEGFAGLLVPTGNKRCGTYVFEPIVGHDTHWGIFKGIHLRGTMWENEAGDIVIETAHDVNGMFMLEKDEIRSFDMKNKPWSRYMEVYTSEAQALQASELELTNPDAARYMSSPGINTFTQCVTVRPGLSSIINSAFLFSAKRFRGEVGYNLYWRQSECVKLCCWKEGAALKDAFGMGDTEPLRTITRENNVFTVNPPDQTVTGTANISTAVSQYSTSIIKKCDLDMESATHPSLVANTLYLSAGARFDEKEYPCFFDLGGSYEFDSENVTLNRWTIWAKGGISF